MILGQIFMSHTICGEPVSKRIGVVWQESDTEYELRLRGWHEGDFVCVTKSKSAPHIQGSLGAVYVNSAGKKAGQWCGRIYSQDDEEGNVVYYGHLAVFPIDALASYIANGGECFALKVKLDEEKK